MANGHDLAFVSHMSRQTDVHDFQAHAEEPIQCC